MDITIRVPAMVGEALEAMAERSGVTVADMVELELRDARFVGDALRASHYPALLTSLSEPCHD